MYVSFWFLVKIRRPSAEDVREAAEALALTASAAPPPPLINQNTPIQSELLTSPALPGSILGGDSQPSQSSPSTTAKDPTLSIYPLKKEPKSANSNYTSSFVKSLADHVDAAIAGDTTYCEALSFRKRKLLISLKIYACLAFFLFRNWSFKQGH